MAAVFAAELFVLSLFLTIFLYFILHYCHIWNTAVAIRWNPWLFILSAIGQEHEVLLRDKLKERNLSFLGKPSLDLVITFLKPVYSWRCCLFVSSGQEDLDMTDAVDVISYWFANSKGLLSNFLGCLCTSCMNISRIKASKVLFNVSLDIMFGPLGWLFSLPFFLFPKMNKASLYLHKYCHSLTGKTSQGLMFRKKKLLILCDCGFWFLTPLRFKRMFP